MNILSPLLFHPLFCTTRRIFFYILVGVSLYCLSALSRSQSRSYRPLFFLSLQPSSHDSTHNNCNSNNNHTKQTLKANKQKRQRSRLSLFPFSPASSSHPSHFVIPTSSPLSSIQTSLRVDQFNWTQIKNIVSCSLLSLSHTPGKKEKKKEGWEKRIRV